MVLGQVSTEEKSNEMTAFPQLLELIRLDGATVSIDAMGCQKKIAEAIVDKRANYLLALKGKPSTLEKEVELGSKLRGHMGYYGIKGNFQAIVRFREEVRRVWQKWLNRRSQRASMRWDRMQCVLQRYPLPRARIRPALPRAANP